MLKPEECHPSHKIYDDGWYVSDVRCVNCGFGEWFDEYRLIYPCEGKQLDLFKEG